MRGAAAASPGRLTDVVWSVSELDRSNRSEPDPRVAICRRVHGTFAYFERRLQCCTAMAFGSSFCLLAPANRAKGLPLIRVSAPLVSIENTSIWLARLSST
jgi:hypothetical protein